MTVPTTDSPVGGSSSQVFRIRKTISSIAVACPEEVPRTAMNTADASKSNTANTAKYCHFCASRQRS